MHTLAPAKEKRPAAQGVQAARAPAAKVPAAQGLQAPIPDALNVPTAHGTQALAPLVKAVVPGAHVLHTPRPTKDLKVPTLQSMHDVICSFG